MPLLSICIPTHADYHGLAFTLQSLTMHHDLTGVEIVVADSDPDSGHGHAVRDLCAWHGERVRYLANPGAAGMIPLEIPDVYAWVAARTAVGDLKPSLAMAKLVEALGEEYSRRVAG